MYSVVCGMLPVIIPTFMSKAESVLNDKGLTISWHDYSYHVPRSNSEGFLERFKHPREGYCDE